MSRRRNTSESRRLQRRAEEREARLRANPPPPKPTPLLMRHLPCLVDPNCTVDHLRRKKRGRSPMVNRFSEKGGSRG